MQSSSEIQNWFVELDRRTAALLVGASIGIAGGVVALMLAALGPVITFAAVLALLAGLYILTNLEAALYGMIAVMALLPFGTLPFSIGFTPTLLDLAIGAVVLVYLLQWMTGQRQTVTLTWVHVLIAFYMLWLLLSFALGLRHAMPTANNIRQFAGSLLSVGLVFIVVDMLRDPILLRRLVVAILAAIGLQAIIAIGLYLIPDVTANNLLNSLGRIGYPTGNVIRYIEATPELGERAIGTWVDPNTLGGVLAIGAALIAPQLLAQKPVLRYRWLTFTVLVVIVLAVILSFSRASMLATAFGLSFVAIIRYRRFLPLLIAGGLLLLLLPQTQNYVGRFVEAFTAADLATQMRIGEYTDSLRLISRYPVFGVGFTGAPDIDIYTDVASMYLIMANQIGLVGLGIYLTLMASVLWYGLGAWKLARRDEELDSIHLGYHAALLTAMVNAVADLYFFRLDFQGTITLFWLTVALALASSRLVLERSSTARR
jgi:polysaccharide biosynthesis protein PslJ